MTSMVRDCSRLCEDGGRLGSEGSQMVVAWVDVKKPRLFLERSQRSIELRTIYTACNLYTKKY